MFRFESLWFRNLLLLLVLNLLPRAAGQLVTRIYAYQTLTPAQVEAEVRRWVPEGGRVLVNPAVNQVMVIAPPETHEQVARIFERLDRPTHRLDLWFRHNQQEGQTLDLIDGDFANFPVTRTPLPHIETEARAMLPFEQQDLPLVGSILNTHFAVLSADPARVRLRLTPALLFGSSPPYEVVRFENLAMDLLITDEAFVDLPDRLAENEFYRMFFRSRAADSDRHRPVGLLLSLQGIRSE